MLAHHAEGSRRTDEHGMARLPVPSLQQTLGAALTSAAPLAKTASELNKLKMKEEAFASGQAAKALQAALQKRREQPETLNWLAEVRGHRSTPLPITSDSMTRSGGTRRRTWPTATRSSSMSATTLASRACHSRHLALL